MVDPSKSHVICVYKDAKFDIPAPNTNTVTDTAKKPRRPLNTSEDDVKKKEQKEKLAKKEITKLYVHAILESNSNNSKKMKHDSYNMIVSKTINKYDLDNMFSFDYHTCIAQIYHGKEESLCSNTESSLKHVENKFVEGKHGNER